MASRPSTKEYRVRLTDYFSSQHKVINIMRFKHPHKCDLDKLTDPVLHRQEIQVDQEKEEEDGKKKEEWRRKRKYRPRKRNPDDLPWILKEKKKDGAIFHGRKEGGINTSASYYILRLGQDGDFEALPVNNWYDFVPPVKYNYLNDEEAEERFEKRNRTLNYFSIMVSKRIKESEGGAEEEDKGRGGGGGPSSGLKPDDSDDDSDGFASPDSDNEVKKGGGGKKGVGSKGKKKKQKKKRLISADVEAEEESDEGDFESKEVDYSSSSSEEDDMIKAVREEPRDDAEVERKEEGGIDKAFEESSSDEEENELTESGKELKALINKTEGETEVKSSEGEGEEGEGEDSKMDVQESEKEPSTLAAKNEVQSSSSSPPAKKPKVEAPSNKILPDEVQKYLTRKPMTSKALVKKFVKLKTDLNKGQVVAMLSVVLKSMPQIDKQKIKGKMYLSLRTD